MRLIVWICDACKKPIDDRAGYIHVSDWQANRRSTEIADWLRTHTRKTLGVMPLSDLLDSPAPIQWQIHHTVCDPAGEDGPDYWADVETLRSMDQLLSWSLHVLDKTWVRDGTDWVAFAESAVERYRAGGLRIVS